MSSLALRMGRGLLVVAMMVAIGCGDDEGGEDPNSGGSGGSGGGSGNDGGDTGGSGGSTGGSGGSTGGSGGGDGGDELTVEECVDQTTAMTAGAVSEECSTCLCEEDIDAASACGTGCWTFIGCMRDHCLDALASGDMPTIVACVTDNCSTEAAGGASGQATAIRTALGECDACDAAPPEGDGGDDAGE